jgi:hypothetical protein
VIGEYYTGDPCLDFSDCYSHYCDEGYCVECVDDTYCATLGGTCGGNGYCNINDCADESACSTS